MDKTQGGGRTIPLPAGPRILSWASVAGKKEGEGPLGASFDLVGAEDSFGEKSWEKAETAMQKRALSLALDKAGLAPGGVDCLLAGDLLNQCIGSAFAAREHGLPFLGLYGACSTMAESLALAALLAEGGFVERAAAVTPLPRKRRRPPRQRALLNLLLVVPPASCALVCAQAHMA